MSSKKSKEIKIGIFTVVVLVCAYLGFNHLKNNNVFGRDYTVIASLEKTNGLDVGSSVLLRGFKIGSVQKVRYDMQSERILVELNLDGNYPLPVNTQFQAGSTSILGGSAIMVSVGDAGAKITEGDTILVANNTPIIDKVTDNLDGIMAKLTTTIEGLNQALSQQNVAALTATLNNAKLATADLQSVLANNRTNINQTLGNLAKLSEQLNQMAPALKTGVQDLAKTANEVSKNAPELMANATKSIENLSSILQKIDQGQGTAGKVVNDEQLYTNLSQTLHDLSLLVTDLQENPSRYINVTVFGKKNKK